MRRYRRDFYVKVSLREIKKYNGYEREQMESLIEAIRDGWQILQVVEKNVYFGESNKNGPALEIKLRKSFYEE